MTAPFKNKHNEIKSQDTSTSDFNAKGDGSFISSNEAGINHRTTDVDGSDEVNNRTYLGGFPSDNEDDEGEDHFIIR